MAKLPSRKDGEFIRPPDPPVRYGYAGAGAGVTDHGALTGLGDDDHAQYLTAAEANAAYQPLDADLTSIAAANNGSVLAATTASFTTADETKLDGVESGATADQSNAEIETAYNAQVAAASQAEAEAGTEAAIRRFSPLRVAQAIAALAPAGGGVDTANSPLAGEFARFTDADTIEGRTAAETRADLGLVIGTNVQAQSANLDEYAAVNPTTAGLALLDDADAPAQRTTLGLGALATLATVGTSQIDNDAVTFAKIQNITDARLLGRSAGSSGDAQEITVGSGLSLSAGALTATGGGTWTTLKQTADDSKTDNTLAASTYMTVALSAATRYTIRGVAYLLVQNASADARFDINYSGTWTTVYCLDSRNVAGVAAGTDARTDRMASALPGSTDMTSTSTGICIVQFEITGLTNASGTLAFRFAQVTNNASATLLKAGSYLEYMTV